MRLSVATCYVPVSADIRRNARYVLHQMRVARRLRADVAHFPEACLPGYAGVDFRSFRGFDWDLLLTCMQDVLALARQLRLWVVVGSAHRLTGRHKPHDSVYMISDRGVVVDRYDKRFCAGEELVHYSPGNHPVVFTLEGIRCGVLVCYEYAFPEMYREYKRRGVKFVFHSFHAGHMSPGDVRAIGQKGRSRDSHLLRSDVKAQRGFAARSQLPGCSSQLRTSGDNGRCARFVQPTW